MLHLSSFGKLSKKDESFLCFMSLDILENQGVEIKASHTILGFRRKTKVRFD